MKAYEAVYIFDPELSEDAVEQLKERIVSLINSNGSLLGVNVWGRKRLAYPIKKKKEGIYYLFEFLGDEGLPRELKRLTTITEPILRSMIVVNERKEKELKTRKFEQEETEKSEPEEISYHKEDTTEKQPEEDIAEEKAENAESEVS